MSRKRTLIAIAVVVAVIGACVLITVLIEQFSTPPDLAGGDGYSAKPVLYLYPTVVTDVDVTLDYGGTLTCTYPDYRDGWRVTAHPDGTLIDRRGGRIYSYLFWEGVDNLACDFSQGFVVRGEDTAAFLQETLANIGLLPHEYNEFVVYWLPLMQDNPYNLISFQGGNYTDIATLDIQPAPDSVLRVYMAYKPLDAWIDVPPQTFEPFERRGFTAVEWGGRLVAGH